MSRKSPKRKAAQPANAPQKRSESSAKARGRKSPTPQQLEKFVHVLSRSQLGYRELIDHLDLLVFTLSLDGRFLVANRPLAKHLNVSFQELIHRPLDEFFSEPGRETLGKAKSVILEKGSWAGVLRARMKKSGEERFFDAAFQVVESAGKVTGISGLARDVTAEQLSEARFTEFFETLQEGVYFSTPQGRILNVNPALVRMLGYEGKEDILGRPAGDFYLDPTERDRLQKELEAQGSLRGRLITLVRRDGTPVLCLNSAIVIRDAAGRVVRYQGTLLDVTDRLAMEKRLRQEQEFVRRLVDSFPDVIVVLDAQGNYTYVSPRVQEFLGYTPEEYKGLRVGAHAHPEDRAAMAEFIGSLLTGKLAHGILDYRSQHKDGSWRYFRAAASPLCDEAGKIVGVVASARDVTESKQLEQQLLQRERFASFGQMLAGAAHELNNPLTAILGVSDLLRERAGDDVMRRQSELVYKQARRAADIVQNLLSMARPSPSSRILVHLDHLIPKALQLQGKSLGQHRINVSFHAEPDVPPVEGDPNLLTQVVLNLIVNAEQAISAARDRGSLRVSLFQSEGEVVARFEDDGPGIPHDAMAKIFDPFFTTKRPGGGAGLGLTIALSVAKDHGGSIEVTSAPGEGAAFLLRLPASESVTAKLPLDATPPLSIPLRGRSVLVVDDEESIRELVAEGLSSRGMAVEGVATCQEAVTALSDRTFDFVLCDYNLAGGKGEEVFEQLRTKPGGSSTKFVFMTGDMLGKAAEISFRERGARLVQKPFQLSSLASLLTELLQSWPAAQ